MSTAPDHIYTISERLSEVMDDIGVNERLVTKRRRSWMLTQDIGNILMDPIMFIIGSNISMYPIRLNIGSQAEGSTTLGLNSDVDMLFMEGYRAIQEMSERKSGDVNFLMIQNENISPGYCYLQCIKFDSSLPGRVNDTDIQVIDQCDTDSEGRLLLKNTYLTNEYFDRVNLIYPTPSKVHGPALTCVTNICLVDMVASFECESSPHQVTSWLQKQRKCKWPKEDVLEKCINVGCLVVPVCSKVSYESDLEWRISTNQQEKFLMVSLNITQLRCYILMKMILKTHINPYVEGVLSSFMCKNVLWYCIANSSQDWHTGNLLSYLHLCLFMLRECVEQRNCPHFIIQENNLMAGHMTDKQRRNLLDVMNNLMKNDKHVLYEIQIDDLGRRLKMKSNVLSYCPDLPSATIISHLIAYELVQHIATVLNTPLTVSLMKGLEMIKHESIEMALPYLFQVLTNMERHKQEEDIHRRTAREFLIALWSSTLGSVLACTNTASHTAISDQAFAYLEAGKESDALSGRLKLVSVLYCTGDMERAERELRISRKHYKQPLFDATCKCNGGFACTCYVKALEHMTLDFMKACDDYDEAVIKSHQPLRVTFLQGELKCVPHELRYEILRSYIEEDRQMRTYDESPWMDLIVVDPVPYLYFLQYKTYGHLQRRKEQQEALSNLVRSINFEPEPGLLNRETALNLLGQCFEQENRQPEAFLCYISSLEHRLRNNAAIFLLCIQLFKLWKQENTL